MAIFDFLKNKKDDKNQGTEISAFLPEDIYQAGALEMRDIISPSAVKVTPKSTNLGNQIIKTFFVISYPRYLTEGWFAPIINLDKIFNISIFVHPVDTASILKKFQSKVAEVQSQISEREKKGFVRDPMLETAYQDLEKLRDDLMQAQEKMFDVGLYISIYGENEDELSKVESEIKSILEAKLIYIKPALFQQGEGFISNVPLGQDEIKVYTKLNSSPLSSSFPFISFDMTSENGVLYGINRHNASLVLFDRFKLDNYNSVTLARSGSGKSYATKLEILRSLMLGADVLVIDPEREYEQLASAVGGKYFNISLNSEHHINPFDLPTPREDETPSDVLRSHIINLVGLFRIMFSGLTPEEDAIVDRAISETYALKDITPNSNFDNTEPPLLSDFETVLAGMEGAESLVSRLSKYTRGTWSGFLNRPSNVHIDNKFIVFSIRDMEDELKPVATFLVTNYIWTAIRKELKKRLLVIDEAWWMMKSEDTASFLTRLIKRGRKYYLGVATITQDVDDFLNSPYGRPIIANSAMQFLLKQSTSSADRLQEIFHLTDEEKYLLLESGIGEGILFVGLKHVALKVVASYTEDQIITSDPSQLLSIRDAKAELEATNT